MERRDITHFLMGPVPAAVLSILLIATLAMLSAAALQSEVYGVYYSALLGVSVLGIIALLVLIAAHVYRMVLQMRAGVLGSRLTLKLIGIFVLLAMIPLAVVYYISVQFLHRGIDSWFDVRIEQALDDALLLGRISLETVKEERVKRVQDLAASLDLVHSKQAMVRALDDLREQAGFTEITLLSQDGRIIASSNLYTGSLIPNRPSNSVLSRIRQGEIYANLEPTADDNLELHIVIPVYPLDVKQPVRVLQVHEPLPLRYSKLGKSVETAYTEFNKLAYLRGPLKLSFVLTLTLVTLVTLLIAVWAAIFSARALTAPLRDLAEGTRAVTQGEYDKQLPESGSDELGVLVKSFNEMTRKIKQAQTVARNSQRETEDQRTYLETVLTHLSSGVLSFDAKGSLRTLNSAASDILLVDLQQDIGKTLKDLITSYSQLEPFFNVIQNAIDNETPEWRTEVTVVGARGRQVITSRGTKMGASKRRGGGYVVVFDDVTKLIQAQRDAAWGEVARRLAHEIKNPLTPIQLSAERIRHRCMSKLDKAERETLDRATRTISEQVESMKSMVNAFSNYAQLKQMQPEKMDLNQLVEDVVELYRGEGNTVVLDLSLDDRLPLIMADRSRLRQVLNNLLTNARDALANNKNQRIELGTHFVQEVDRSYVELTVLDNGPGFQEALLDRLFEPYVTTKEKGNGLGLAIVKKIVEEHGGTVWAQNRKGIGASLTIRLPMDVQQNRGDSDDLVSPPVDTQTQEKIA